MKRTLEPTEIKQIAGRAGRFGIYEEGFVAAIDGIEIIEDGLSRLPVPIMKAYVGFPEQLLELPAEIDNLIKIWASMDAPAIYQKMEVDELLALYQHFLMVHRDRLNEFAKPEIYKLITCAIDINNKMVVDLWKDYCREYREVDELEFPYSPARICMIWKAITRCWICIFSFPGRRGCLFRLKILHRSAMRQRKRSAVS